MLQSTQQHLTQEVAFIASHRSYDAMCHMPTHNTSSCQSNELYEHWQAND